MTQQATGDGRPAAARRRKIWHIRCWRERYEPQDSKRRGAKSPLQYVKDYVRGDNKVIDRQQLDQERRAMVKAGGRDLLLLWAELKRAAADRSWFRGYFLDHAGRPATVRQIAEMLPAELEYTPDQVRRGLKALARAEIGVVERVPADQVSDGQYVDGEIEDPETGAVKAGRVWESVGLGDIYGAAAGNGRGAAEIGGNARKKTAKFRDGSREHEREREREQKREHPDPGGSGYEQEQKTAGSDYTDAEGATGGAGARTRTGGPATATRTATEEPADGDANASGDGDGKAGGRPDTNTPATATRPSEGAGGRGGIERSPPPVCSESPGRGGPARPGPLAELLKRMPMEKIAMQPSIMGQAIYMALGLRKTSVREINSEKAAIAALWNEVLAALDLPDVASERIVQFAAKRVSKARHLAATPAEGLGPMKMEDGRGHPIGEIEAAEKARARIWMADTRKQAAKLAETLAAGVGGRNAAETGAAGGK